MASGELADKVKELRSRINLRDRKTQLGIASAFAAVVLVLALVALPNGKKASHGKTAGSTSQQAIDALRENTAAAESKTGNGPLAGGSSKSSGSVSGAAPSVGGSAPADLPPITATKVKVGIAYSSDPGAANAAAGFAGIGQVDQKRGWEAMLKEINKNPPFGRKLVPVWYATTTDQIESKGQERLEQEACALWTKDNRVFMVWDGIVGYETIHACLTKAGIPDVGGADASADWFKKYPYNVQPRDAALDRMAAFQIDRLFEGDFFKKFKDQDVGYTPTKPVDGKPKIGLIRYDQPAFKAAAVVMKDRLAAHGLSLCAGCEFEVSYSAASIPDQLDDATEVNAAIQNCKAKDCTHMLFLGSQAGCRITLFFIDGAEKQRYRPRLGLNPLDCSNVIKADLGPDSYPQYKQSMLVTWDPNDFGVPSEGYKKCQKLFEDAGETFGGDDKAGNKQAQIPFYCDTAWYTHAVLETAGSSLSLQSFMHGVATVPPVEAAATYVMQTKADRRDGVGAIRRGEFFDDCHCFRATSPIILV